MSKGDELMDMNTKVQLRDACLKVAAHEQKNNPKVSNLLNGIEAIQAEADEKKGKAKIEIEKILEEFIAPQYRYTEEEWGAVTVARRAPAKQMRRDARAERKRG